MIQAGETSNWRSNKLTLAKWQMHTGLFNLFDSTRFKTLNPHVVLVNGWSISGLYGYTCYMLSSSPEWFTNELCTGYLKRWKCPLRPAASPMAWYCIGPMYTWTKSKTTTSRHCLKIALLWGIKILFPKKFDDKLRIVAQLCVNPIFFKGSKKKPLHICDQMMLT